MSVPEAPGARLYYELRGEGPLLAVVPGAKGEADIYRDLADELSTRYQVMTYDRRGFSRSQLDGAQDYQRRLATDADDARGLIRHLGDEPATVYGNSTGALVALEVLIRHPDVVRTVIAYEPRMVRLLPDGEQWVAFFQRVYDSYRTLGVVPALKLFAEGTRIAGSSDARPRSTSRTPTRVAWWRRTSCTGSSTNSGNIRTSSLTLRRWLNMPTDSSSPGDANPSSTSPTGRTPCWPLSSERAYWTFPAAMPAASRIRPSSHADC